MPATITPERPDSPDAVALINELDAYLEPLYPRESRYGYAVEKLIKEGVSFFVIRVEGAPAGCGGVQFYADGYAEVKRMWVRPAFRGKGLAKMMIGFLERLVRERGVAVLRLETGVHQHEAIRLYEGLGFARIGPFGDYWGDPLSCFYEKRV
jgi:ribosomal protein S18 acetylase RimI-like enzyme